MIQVYFYTPCAHASNVVEKGTSTIQLYRYVAPSINFSPLQMYLWNIQGQEDVRKLAEGEIQSCEEHE